MMELIAAIALMYTTVGAAALLVRKQQQLRAQEGEEA